jgi:hypothetical protein
MGLHPPVRECGVWQARRVVGWGAAAPAPAPAPAPAYRWRVRPAVVFGLDPESMWAATSWVAIHVYVLEYSHEYSYTSTLQSLQHLQLAKYKHIRMATSKKR